MNYIHAHSFNNDAHSGYTKYAQVVYSVTKYGKPLPTVTQIVYADFDPNTDINFGEGCRHVALTENDEVSPGMVLDPTSPVPDNNTFLKFEDAFRILHTDYELMHYVRERRAHALASCDALVMRHRDQLDLGTTTTLTAAQYTELLTYRQALRDLPDTVDLDDIKLPEMPSFMQPQIPQG